MSRSPTPAELLEVEAAIKTHAALGDPGVRNRIAELEAALRPFAAFADAMAKMVRTRTNYPREGEVYTLMVDSQRVELTVEDFRAARAAIR